MFPTVSFLPEGELMRSVNAVPHILSPAVRLGDTLYLSGQTPIDGTGKVVDGDIEELTE